MTSKHGMASGSVPATSPPGTAAPPPEPVADERLAQISPMARLLRRPEIGALLAAVVVAIFFWTQNSLFLKLDGIANWTDVASTIGIPAVVVALLMIGGEFDLSAGVMTGSAGLMMGILATEVGMNIWLAIVLTLIAATAVGFTQRLHGHDDEAAELHRHAGHLLHPAGRQPRRDQGDHQPGVGQRPRHRGRLRQRATRSSAGPSGRRTTSRSPSCGGSRSPRSPRGSLARTRVGNWIFGVGGDANAARNVGVPVARVKIGLFMTTSFVCALTGIMIALRLASTQAGQGVGDEFQYIIAAVVGGCVLTGGFGSAIGAALGATIIGMAFIGIQFSGWNTDWRFLFLGVILLVAVLVNNYIRKRAEGARR